MVIDAAPVLFGHVLSPSLLDAMIVAATGKFPQEILEDDYLEIITSLGLEPRIIYPNGFKRVNRFAFVIHPLSQEYFKKVKPIELLSHVSPPMFMNSLEKIMAYAPPFVYSKVTGIQSPTGVETEGWLISVGGTPREIMAHSPEFTYRRLLDAAAMARRLGAQIMGLGAFTKVVGDAGLTVAKRAPLPITTGNSYSASGALWAAHDALCACACCPAQGQGARQVQGHDRRRHRRHRLGLRAPDGQGGRRGLHGLARDGQAAGAQGIHPQGVARRQALPVRPGRQGHRRHGHDRHRHLRRRQEGAGHHEGQARLRDHRRGAPAGPAAEEVAKRPDVLVIESGEIQLPGNVEMKNIGLPKGVAYACLAETIVLALEGRFENFTVGRAIEWEKVREIYKLGIKHGMKLAAISGVNGPFSDEDIERVRELALDPRASPRGAPPPRKRPHPPKPHPGARAPRPPRPPEAGPGGRPGRLIR
jgi:hypothetical protein